MGLGFELFRLLGASGRRPQVLLGGFSDDHDVPVKRSQQRCECREGQKHGIRFC